MKIKSKKPLNWWKKKFWSVFSQYIRQRDKGVCFTCNKVISDYYDRYGTLLEGWKAGQAGHFITAKNCGLKLYFHEQNVHCQCYHCNVNLSGNWLEYEKKIIQVYGQEFCDKLKAMKYEPDIKYKDFDYERLIEEYKEKIRELPEEASDGR